MSRLDRWFRTIQPDASTMMMGLPSRRPAGKLFDLQRLTRENRGANEAIIRSLSTNAYLGDETVLCRSLGRYKIYADAADHGLSPHIVLDGYWEMWVTEVIAAHLRPGMIAADIGANIGYYTLLMADLVGSRGCVHAFEPNPRMVRLLQRSVEINGFIPRTYIHQTALGETEGAALGFHVPEHEPKNGHLLPADCVLPPGTPVLTTRRLDSEDAWRSIEFAKIDVEGAEELIWSGAKGLLDGTALKTVVLEFTPGRYADAGEFLDRILSFGFSSAIIDPHEGVVSCGRDRILAGNPLDDVLLLLRR